MYKILRFLGTVNFTGSCGCQNFTIKHTVITHHGMPVNFTVKNVFLFVINLYGKTYDILYTSKSTQMHQ